MLKSTLLDYNPVARLFSGIVSTFTPLGDLATYIRSLLFNKDDEVLQKLLFLLGTAAITYKTGKFLYNIGRYWSWVPSHIANAKKLTENNLKKRYGTCFVVITGFTEGIGRAYAQVFAEFGFNLLLIGRNKEKVQTKVAELSKLYKNIRIQYLISNLSDMNHISELEGQLARFGDLDIGIVINNAGSVSVGQYINVKGTHLISDLIVDLYAVFTLNRILLPKMRAREHRSAIINISSVTGVYLSGLLGVYSSAKMALDIYSRILALQNKDKVDVQSLRPLGVATKMMKMKKGPFMITPRECVRASLNDLLLGQSATFGHFKHKLSSSLAFAPYSEAHNFQVFQKLWKSMG